jgi:hypothetical protein
VAIIHSTLSRSRDGISAAGVSSRKLPVASRTPAPPATRHATPGQTGVIDQHSPVITTRPGCTASWAGLAEGTDEGDGDGPATLVTWGEDTNGDGQDWDVSWGDLAAYGTAPGLA